MRNPRRTAATASALVVGLSLVCLVAIFSTSTKESLRDAVDGGVTADYVLNADQLVPFSPEVAEAIRDLPAVEAVSGIRSGPDQRRRHHRVHRRRRCERPRGRHRPRPAGGQHRRPDRGRDPHPRERGRRLRRRGGGHDAGRLLQPGPDERAGRRHLRAAELHRRVPRPHVPARPGDVPDELRWTRPGLAGVCHGQGRPPRRGARSDRGSPR